MTGWWLPVIAFVSMVAQDMLGTRLVQAEASYRPHLSAAMDTAQDACTITSLWAIGDSLFTGHDLLLTAAVIGARLLADYSGTYTGVRLGKFLDHRKVLP
jgi:hypothetical protein